MTQPELQSGRIYSWDELGAIFGFGPNYLGAAGGMPSRPAIGALLLITHPGGAKSFDYEDEWDGADLIYTGRGKRGDQQLRGQNRDVAENAKKLYVFQPAGPRALQYLGSPICVEHFPGSGLDANGKMRRTWRFRLRFEGAADRSWRPAPPAERQLPIRRPRPFEASRPPRPPVPGKVKATPEELAQLREKANTTHFEILVALQAALASNGWTDIGEIPGAVDLWARRARDGRRVIFEAKGISSANEVHQARTALAQLLEYRHFYGSPEDGLCIVTNRPLSRQRTGFLEEQGVASAFLNEGSFRPSGSVSRELLGALAGS